MAAARKGCGDRIDSSSHAGRLGVGVADGEVDRSRGAWRERDGGDLAAFAQRGGYGASAPARARPSTWHGRRAAAGLL
jgi:hypothetical protein